MSAFLEINLHQQSIFIVDDEPANLKLLDKILTFAGYTNLTLISDPRQVIPAYHEHRPSLILLDLNMPGVDGYQVMKQLGDLGDPIVPPIIILTAQNQQDYLLRALEAGARDFISKPFDRRELLMRVHNSLDAHTAHRLVHNQKVHLEILVEERTQELRESRLEIIRRLGHAAEWRDEETGNHIIRMSKMCALLASKAGWSEEQCDLILQASPMHDIGKIGIPDAILLKPGTLDPQEWQTMKTHPKIGGRLLEGNNSELLVLAREIALNHHEKWDGSGYPGGLRGEDIPLSGRIAALADVFDALTSARPYKKAWPVEDAVELVRENRGTHFDPELVDLFLADVASFVKIIDVYQDQPDHLCQ
ncbi:MULTISPECIES: HD domain-containing phosphohydrolase [unclassified Marinobacter]|uniref:HD domain-containing phosphohydrolase n=1 Tax=unclassified Marinobacter TaxID=83889 RepID=UPI000BF94197|nr:MULTISPECIES: HD domain-containing phosphohydrolase [unclassified Marinobacter]PFG10221.1 putative two-component system response regulator [Marinobacter sp. LV10MA510-1]PFG52149.1 putative two-component system response regulator [Marinobacter sp. LV10R520-4]